MVSRHTGSQSPFIGKATCAGGTAECAEAYGAAVFTIDEVAAGEETAKPRAAQRPKTQAAAADTARRTSSQNTAASLPKDGRPPGQSIEEYVRSQTARQQGQRYTAPAQGQSAPVPVGIPGGNGYTVPGVPRMPGY